MLLVLNDSVKKCENTYGDKLFVSSSTVENE